MPQFQKGNTAGRGRPRGSKNKVLSLPNNLTALAIKNLTEAAEAGESWATIEILRRVVPCFKPITATGSLDGDLLSEKIKEIREFENRLVVLEQANEH